MFVKLRVGKLVGTHWVDAGGVVEINDDRMFRFLTAKVDGNGNPIEPVGEPHGGPATVEGIEFDKPGELPPEVRQAQADRLLARGQAQEEALAGGGTVEDAIAAGRAATEAHGTTGTAQVAGAIKGGPGPGHHEHRPEPEHRPKK